jgi:hypothetical protein
VLRRLVAATAAGVLLVSGCSAPATSRTAPALDTTLTRDGAQAQMFAPFTEVLSRIPAALSLAQTPPRPTQGGQEAGITVPCNDDNTVTTGPLNLQVAFWVQGVATGGETDAYRALVQAFADVGWSTVPDENGPSEITRAYTPDGYAIIVQLNSVGGLSLTGSSPCFPAANDTTTAPQPTAIPHPAG